MRHIHSTACGLSPPTARLSVMPPKTLMPGTCLRTSQARSAVWVTWFLNTIASIWRDGGQRGQLVVVDRAAEDVGRGVGVEVDQALDRADRGRGRGVALHPGTGGGPGGGTGRPRVRGAGGPPRAPRRCQSDRSGGAPVAAATDEMGHVSGDSIHSAPAGQAAHGPREGCAMPLPDRPSLEYLKKLAKDRLQELRRADRSARLAQAQLAVAREHGFPSWRALRAEVDRRLATPEPDPGRPALRRDPAPARRPTVDRLLAAHPALANARDEEGSTPLTAAVDAHRAALIPLLLRRGGDPHLVYAHSAHTPLSWAVVIGPTTGRVPSWGPASSPTCSAPPGWARWSGCAPSSPPRAGSRPRASITGSSRYAPDGARLPCPPATDREIVSDALYMACRAGHEGTARELLDARARSRVPGLRGRHRAALGVLRGRAPGGGAPARRGGGPHAPRSRARLHAGGVRHLRARELGVGSKVRERLGQDPGLVGAESRRGGPLHEAAHAGEPRGGEGAGGGGGGSGAAQRGRADGARPGAGARRIRRGCVAVAEWLVGSAPEPRRP